MGGGSGLHWLIVWGLHFNLNVFHVWTRSMLVGISVPLRIGKNARAKHWRRRRHEGLFAMWRNSEREGRTGAGVTGDVELFAADLSFGGNQFAILMRKRGARSFLESSGALCFVLCSLVAVLLQIIFEQQLETRRPVLLRVTHVVRRCPGSYII